MEPKLLPTRNNRIAFSGLEQVLDVLDHECLTAGRFHDIHKISPHRTPRIASTIACQVRQSLTRRATDHNIGFRLNTASFDEVGDVFLMNMIAEVFTICRCEIWLLLNREDGDESRSFEAERHAASSRKQVDQCVGHRHTLAPSIGSFSRLPSQLSQCTPLAQAQPLREEIAVAAQELDHLRCHWLNPAEWTKTEFLEFPGTIGGPWDRYIERATDSVARRVSEGSESRSASGGQNPRWRVGLVENSPGADASGSGGREIGTVRYPRVVPKDDASAAQLKKRTLTYLYNERPTWLDLAHQKLDAAVFAAYGWDAGMSDDALLVALLKLHLERQRAGGRESPVLRGTRSAGRA